jgi:spore coat protein JB
MDNERNELLKKITELDFMSIDIALYLNTHPTDCEAIECYNKIVRASDTLKSKYEKNIGPLNSFRSLNKCDNVWQWPECPWPWEKDFNYDIKSEVCR